MAQLFVIIAQSPVTNTNGIVTVQNSRNTLSDSDIYERIDDLSISPEYSWNNTYNRQTVFNSTNGYGMNTNKVTNRTTEFFSDFANDTIDFSEGDDESISISSDLTKTITGNMLKVQYSGVDNAPWHYPFIRIFFSRWISKTYWDVQLRINSSQINFIKFGIADTELTQAYTKDGSYYITFPSVLTTITVPDAVNSEPMGRIDIYLYDFADQSFNSSDILFLDFFYVLQANDSYSTAPDYFENEFGDAVDFDDSDGLLWNSTGQFWEQTGLSAGIVSWSVVGTAGSWTAIKKPCDFNGQIYSQAVFRIKATENLKLYIADADAVSNYVNITTTYQILTINVSIWESSESLFVFKVVENDGSNFDGDESIHIDYILLRTTITTASKQNIPINTEYFKSVKGDAIDFAEGDTEGSDYGGSVSGGLFTKNGNADSFIFSNELTNDFKYYSSINARIKLNTTAAIISTIIIYSANGMRVLNPIYFPINLWISVNINWKSNYWYDSNFDINTINRLHIYFNFSGSIPYSFQMDYLRAFNDLSEGIYQRKTLNMVDEFEYSLIFGSYSVNSNISVLLTNNEPNMFTELNQSIGLVFSLYSSNISVFWEYYSIINTLESDFLINLSYDNNYKIKYQFSLEKSNFIVSVDDIATDSNLYKHSWQYQFVPGSKPIIFTFPNENQLYLTIASQLQSQNNITNVVLFDYFSATFDKRNWKILQNDFGQINNAVTSPYYQNIKGTTNGILFTQNYSLVSKNIDIFSFNYQLSHYNITDFYNIEVKIFSITKTQQLAEIAGFRHYYNSGTPSLFRTLKNNVTVDSDYPKWFVSSDIDGWTSFVHYSAVNVVFRAQKDQFIATYTFLNENNKTRTFSTVSAINTKNVLITIAYQIDTIDSQGLFIAGLQKAILSDGYLIQEGGGNIGDSPIFPQVPSVAPASTGNPIVDALASLLKPLFDFLNAILLAFFTGIAVILQAVLKPISDGISSLQNAIGTFFTNLQSGLTSAFGSIISGLESGIGGFITGLQTGIDVIIDGLQSALETAITNLQTGIGTFISDLQTNIGSFISTLQTAIGSFITDLQNVLTPLLDSIITNIQLLVSDIVDYLLSVITDFILPIYEFLLLQALDYLVIFKDWATVNFPILATLIDLGLAFIGLIQFAITFIIEFIPNLLSWVVGTYDLLQTIIADNLIAHLLTLFSQYFVSLYAIFWLLMIAYPFMKQTADPVREAMGNIKSVIDMHIKLYQFVINVLSDIMQLIIQIVMLIRNMIPLI